MKSKKQKKAMLRSISTDKIRHDLKTAVPNFNDVNTTYKHCIYKLHSMYEPEKNIIAERYQFCKMEQLSIECLEDCQLTDRDDQIRDHIVFKSTSTKLRHAALKHG